MSKPTFLSVCLADFPGFYESRLSAILDYELESLAESRAEDMTSAKYNPESYQPEELRLTADEIGSFAWDFVDYAKGESMIARDWCEAYAAALSREVGFTVRFIFEEMDSPREYNFTTDRVFVKVAVSTVRKLFAISRKDGHESLRHRIAGRFTSCSGFISSYPNDLASWLEKPVTEWDHNELGTLFAAVGDIVGNALDDSATEACSEESYVYLDAAMDWRKLDAKIADEIENKRHDLPEDHPLFVGKTFFPCREQLTFNFGSEG